MAVPDRQELRRWSAALSLAPLDVSVPDQEARYVELADAGRGAVDAMQATIELSLETTTQLLSGPSGSGKSTELFRLRRDLDDAGYHAAVVDITSYLNESSAVDVTEFLIALALSAHDVLGPGLPELSRPSFASRLGRMLQRLNVDIEIAGVKAALSTDSIEVEALGAKVGIDLGEELKSSKPLVDELRGKLSYHVKQLYDEVAGFLRDLLPADLGLGAVLIVDGLEKLRGTTANDQDVQSSIEQLFVHHAAKLKFSSHHLVYTVPTYLQFTSPGALPYEGRSLVPVPHLYPRPGGTDDEATAAQNRCELREVVRRRIPVDEIFGPDPAVLELAIDASGGHLRDLFLILQRLINLVLRLSVSMPVEAGHVEEAIRSVGRDFGAMTEEQAAFLRGVAAGDGIVRPAADEVALMARLVQNHMLLGHVNGEQWYEVHPLARRALDLS